MPRCSAARWRRRRGAAAASSGSTRWRDGRATHRKPPASRRHCRMSISTRRPTPCKACPRSNLIWRGYEHDPEKWRPAFPATNAKRLRGDHAPKDNMMGAHVEVMDLVAEMKAAEQAFVLATVVRTVSVTAAKAGAKAIIRPDGTIG